MTMTNDPYRAPEMPADPTRRDLPKTEPRYVDAEETQATIWLPIAIVIALLIGVGYYLYGHAWNTSPNMRAESGAVTKSEPSPN